MVRNVDCAMGLLQHQKPETTPKLAFLLFPINGANKQPLVLKALSLDVGILADFYIDCVSATHI